MAQILGHPRVHSPHLQDDMGWGGTPCHACPGQEGFGAKDRLVLAELAVDKGWPAVALGDTSDSDITG